MNSEAFPPKLAKHQSRCLKPDWSVAVAPQIGHTRRPSCASLIARNLDILVEEGNLRKVKVSDEPNRFDLTLKNHYHVRCVNCGEISDVDMDEILGLLEKIHDTHGTDFLGYDILFKDICPKCQKKIKDGQIY